ncbi:hypothetical protein TNCV_2168781 [Trichonephila clavipes]|nr:hypothetical protein TNCV_2168781 [Trichonephila clavipes]
MKVWLENIGENQRSAICPPLSEKSTITIVDGGLKVWAGVTFDGRTFRYVFARGSLKVVRYKDEVSEPYVCLLTAAVGSDFILMDDNYFNTLFSGIKSQWEACLSEREDHTSY